MTDGIATGFQGIQQQDRQGGDTRAFETAAKKATGGGQAPVFDRFPDKGIVHLHEGQQFVYDFASSDPDGGKVTYSLTHKADGEKFHIDPHTGHLVFIDAPDFDHPTDGNRDNVYDVEIKLTDEQGQTTQKTIWVKVAEKDGGNTAPEFTRFPENGKITVQEGVEGEIFNFNRTDADGDHVTYSVGGADGDKFQITEDKGRLSFKTAPDFEAPTDGNRENVYDVDIILDDGRGGVTTRTVWVMVTDKAETPAGPQITNKAKDGIYFIDENTKTVTDFEATGDGVRFSLNPTKADGEFFTIDEHTGELSFKDAPDFENPLDGTNTPPDNIYDVEIIVTDAHGQTDKCDIWVKVKDVDEKVEEKPVFTNLPGNGQLAIDENETFVIDVEGNDPDGGAVTYSITGGADGAKFTIDENTGKLSFKDAPDFENPADRNNDNKYDVKVTITDDEGESCDKLLWVMVNDVDETPPNEKPVFTNLPDDGKVHLDENQTAVIDIEARDPNGDQLTYSITGGRDGDKFTIDAHTGELSFKDAPDFENPASGGNNNTYDVKVTVSDGQESCDKMLWVMIKDVDETPPNSVDAVDDRGNTTEQGQAITIDVTGNDTDPEGDAFEVKQIAGQDVEVDGTVDVANGTATLRADGNIEFTPNADFSGDTSFEYTIEDAIGAVDTATVFVTVNERVDEKPVFTNLPDDGKITIPEGQVKVVDVDGIDPDGGDVTFSLKDKADSGKFTIDAHTGELSFKDAPDFENPTDGNKNNIYDVHVRIKDDEGNVCDKTLWVMISDVDENTAPTAVDDGATTGFGEAVTIDVVGNDTDPENDALTITGTTDPANGSVEVVDGQIVYTPADGFSGEDTFTYTITDGEETSTATVSVTVGEKPNGKPVFDNLPADGKIHLDEGKVAVVDVDGSDPDGDDLTYSIVGGRDAEFFTIDAETGELSFIEARDFENPASGGNNNTYDVKVRVSDGDKSCDKALWVMIKDLDENGPPVAVDDGFTAEQSGPGAPFQADLPLRANDTDPDGDDLEIVSINGVNLNDTEPAGFNTGSIAVPGGDVFITFNDIAGEDRILGIRFVADLDFSGDSEFTYTIADPDGLTSTANVTVNVPAEANLPPEAVDDTYATGQGERVSVPFYSNDSDPNGDFQREFLVSEVAGVPVDGAVQTVELDGGTLEFAFDTDYLPDNGLPAVFDANFTPNADFVGEQTFEYTLTDRAGATSTATVTINVEAAPNEKPTFDGGIGPDAPKKDRVVHVDENTIEVIDIDATDPDGDPVSFEIVDRADGGSFEIDAQTGELTFKHAPDFENPTDGNKNNVYDVTIRVKDDQGNECDTTLWVKVKDIDETPDPIAPTASDDGAETQPGQSVIVNATANDDDPDGANDALTVATVNGLPIAPLPDPVPPVLVTPDTAQVTNGIVKLLPDGTFQVTPNDGFEGGDITFEYTVRDEQGLESGPATVTVAVGKTVVDPKPVAGDDMVMTDENTAVTGDVTGNDKVEELPATYEATSQPANGTLEFRHDGTFTYTPDDGFDGVDMFTYEVTDASDDKATATVMILVKDTIADNRKPDAENDSVDTDENVAVAIDVLGNDSDPEGDDLAITATTDPANGSIEIVNGEIVYTPDDGFAGMDEFTYTISDGELTDTATVKICVKDTIADNQAPVARDDNASTEFGAPVSIDAYANDFDPDGAGNAVFPGQIVDQPVNGTVELVDGQFVYTPNDGFSGDDRFTYTVIDDEGLESAPATVSIHVGAENLEPVAVNDGESVESGQTLTASVAGNDTLGDGDNTFAVSMDAMNGTVTLAEDGSYTYEANAGFVGNDVFRYTITDADGDSSTATVRIEVTAANKLPDAVDDSATTESGTAATGNVLGNDDLGDGLGSVAVTDEPVNGTVVLEPDGSYTYTPNVDFAGDDAFTYTLTDANGDSSTAKVTITVEAKNLVPDAVNDSASTVEGEPVEGDVSGNDVRGDDPANNTFALVADAMNGTVAFNADGTFTYTPADGFVGNDRFTYSITDGNGDTDRASVHVSVAAKPDAGVDAVDDANTTVEGTPVSGNVLTNDVDGDAPRDLKAFLASQPANGRVTLARDGSYTYTPAESFVGEDTFSYLAIDEDGDQDLATVTITVTDDGKEAPVAKRDTADTAPGEAVDIDVTANDDDPNGDNDALVVTQVNGRPISSDVNGTVGNTVLVNNGSVTLLPNGDLRVEPNPGFEGGDIRFNYTVRDEEGLTDRAGVVVHVGAGNAAPDADDDNVDTDFGQPVTIAVLANDSDPDGDAISVTEVGDAANGTVTLNADGTVTYEPDAGFSGDDTFTYTITDGTETDTATVTVHVGEDDTPPPPPPVDNKPDAKFDRNSTDFETPVSGSVAGNDDPGDRPATFSLIREPANGTVVFNADGTYTYTPDAGFSGNDTFRYEIKDADGDTDRASVRITVGEDKTPPADKAPDAIDDAFDGEFGQPISGDASANDVDGDGDSTFALATEPANGTVAFNADGTFVYTPNAGFSGDDSFTYTIRDADGDVDTATVSLHVGEDQTPPPPANNRPDAVADVDTTDEGETVNIDVIANDSDPDGDAIEVTRVVTQPGNGTAVLLADGTIDYTPADGFFGEDTFTYEIRDDAGLTDIATVTVTVDEDVAPPPPPADKRPDAVNDAFDGVGGQPIAASVATNDDLGDTPSTFATLTQPQNGTLAFNEDGSFVYTPNFGFTGTDSFVYTVTDADGDMDAAVVKLNVAKDTADIQPVARNDDFDVTAGDTITDTVATNDELGNTPSVFSLVSQPAKGTVTFNTDGTFTYTANDGATGTDAFAYQITDADGDVSVATVCLKIEDDTPPPPADKQPDAVNDAETTEFDTPITASVAGNDVAGDGDSTFALATPPSNGTVTFNADGSYTYTPNAGFVGVDTFTYAIRDADGDVDTATVSITVKADDTPPPPPPADKQPDAVDDRFNGEFGQQITGFVFPNDTFGDGQNTFALVSQPNGGTVQLGETGFFRFTPDAGFSGDTSFQYRITDADGDTDVATVFLHVAEDKTPPPPPPPADKQPDAVNDAETTEFDTPITASVAGNDVAGDGDSTFALATPPSNGTVVFNADGSYTYTPNAGFVGVDTFTYTIRDADGDVDTATVAITVKADDMPPPPPPPVDEKPVFTNLPADGKIHIDEGVIQVVDIDGVDPDGGEVTFSIVGGADAGSFTIDPATGKLAFKGATEFEHPGDRNRDNVYDVKVRITDDEGTTCDKVLWVKVKDVDQQLPPVAVDDAATTDQGDTVTIDVIGNDTEPEGETIRVTGIATPPANGTATVNADGTIDYTPNANFFGTDTFEYTIVDEDGLTDTATVTVTVDKDVPVNKPPHAVNDMAMGPAGKPLTVNVLANDKDPDGDPLTITSLAGRDVKPGDVIEGPNVSVRVNDGGTLTFTPRDGYVGTVTYFYHVSDGKGGTDTGRVVVEFKDDTPPPPPPPVNQPPHAVKDGYTLTPGRHYILPILHNDKDPDGDPLKIVKINGHELKPCQSLRVEGGIVTLRKDGQLVFKGNRGTYGDFQFDYTISDGKGGFDTAPVYICLTAGGRRH